ncbi:MAG TPA: glycosyl hydrolase family 8 [Opitutus sp.]|nr:glycosyl hydrolase family 8 [Opitutus sp.]
MRKLVPFLLLGLAAASPAPAAEPQGAAATGHYRNLFAELLGKSDAEVSAKIDAAFHQLFYGDENSQRLFYPIGDGSMAYVPDVANNDVRTEGLSYAMMICVQTNHQKEFNQVWKFAKTYMWHASGPFAGYFTWHVAFNGHKLRDVGPAPDGEEWFTMALFFAAHRWGSNDVGRGLPLPPESAGRTSPAENIFNYSAEAQAILHTMLHKHDEPGHGIVGDMFDRDAKEVVFVPEQWRDRFTDPSYHLPMFYELWARWAADPADRTFLAGVAKTSRDIFQKAANPQTGLMPDTTNFDGTPYARWGGPSEFRYDAWRTLAYPALDWSWWAADPREIAQSNRVLTFLASHGANIPDRYKIDGTPVSTDMNTPGLTATSAVAGLAADPAIAKPFVQRLWDQPMPTGRKRYYDGLLTMLALLECSGQFQIYNPR